ncbi:RNA polymerase sigma factor SigM [Nocardioides guangzhouensis]|uniref:RNA polymerase sigma factor SigM n=1 Tax=Nocardioides guangzhouensis TaxID=2497878 RepID=A0A4V1XYM7_9ACTN|nr:RNA polymerase sigma factor SigM [Nocardioides guangzhouensis]RYP83789.1 RNA polymerase sigma factor SigM [Nocardioides guangzhouensis]
MSTGGPREPGPDGHDVPVGPRTDRDLLAAHVAGDHDAFGELFTRHRDRLWAVALRTMGNPEDAADGLQDGMIAAFRRAASFRGDAAVTTWLHRVVVNACLDRIRAARVRAADALPDDLDAYTGRGTLGTAAPDPGPDDTALAAERRRLVLDALAALPAEQRAALVLVDMEGYGVAEAAEILDCAVGTVKSRCARGRARLAPLLGVLRNAGDDEPPAPGNPAGPAAVPSTDPARGPPE